MVLSAQQNQLGLSVVDFDQTQRYLLEFDESDDEALGKLALEARNGEGSETASKVSKTQLWLIYSLHLAEAYV